MGSSRSLSARKKARAAKKQPAQVLQDSEDDVARATQESTQSHGPKRRSNRLATQNLNTIPEEAEKESDIDNGVKSDMPDNTEVEEINTRVHADTMIASLLGNSEFGEEVFSSNDELEELDIAKVVKTKQNSKQTKPRSSSAEQKIEDIAGKVFQNSFKIKC